MILGGGSSLITFNVNGVEYQAEDGITWEEFIDSEYNTYGYFTSSNSIVLHNDHYFIKGLNSIRITDLIVGNGSYQDSNAGGSV